MYYVCHNTHILVKGKMKKDEKNEEKKRMNPWFYAIFWLSRQKLAKFGGHRPGHQCPRADRAGESVVAGHAMPIWQDLVRSRLSARLPDREVALLATCADRSRHKP